MFTNFMSTIRDPLERQGFVLSSEDHHRGQRFLILNLQLQLVHRLEFEPMTFHM